MRINGFQLGCAIILSGLLIKNFEFYIGQSWLGTTLLMLFCFCFWYFAFDDGKGANSK